MRKSTDCLVIGGGFAGLTAALVLRRAGRSVAVLEARDRIGGRARTTELLPGLPVDLGGQWVGPGQKRMLALADTHGARLVRSFETGRGLISDCGLVGELGAPSGELGARAYLEIGRALAAFDARVAMAEGEGEGQSVADWIVESVKEPAARRLLQAIFRIQLAREPETVPIARALEFVALTGRSLADLMSMSGGALESRFAQGTGALLAKMAEPLTAGLLLNAPAVSIEQNAESVLVRTRAGDFRARRAIVAVPPNVVSRIEFSPGLSGERTALLGSYRMGSVVKCLAVYEAPFWRARGLSGLASATDGPLVSVCDNSPEGDGRGVLLAFAAGESAVRLANLASEERRALVLNELARLFGPEAWRPAAYTDRVWSEEEWTGGGFFALTHEARASERLREPTGRLHWAGTETAREWMGFMEGAVESGERAADEVIRNDASGVGRG